VTLQLATGEIQQSQSQKKTVKDQFNCCSCKTWQLGYDWHHCTFLGICATKSCTFLLPSSSGTIKLANPGSPGRMAVKTDREKDLHINWARSVLWY